MGYAMLVQKIPQLILRQGKEFEHTSFLPVLLVG